MRTRTSCNTLSWSIALVLLGTATGIAEADDKAASYKWVDENGVTHYGDRIPPQYAKQDAGAVEKDFDGLRIDHPVNSNHNGGQMMFGRDGYLWITTGDGGSRNRPRC